MCFPKGNLLIKYMTPVEIVKHKIIVNGIPIIGLIKSHRMLKSSNLLKTNI